ncbi:hypothetical protein Psuf_059420 [Phytohabitans suffuscus]|uniref:2-hydroxyhepta-2,4-diene-1,7-dioate isomerase n=1 Tax=Phytohabitans suffuscus TaxID=624315 RepID=A0A6F8YRE2_9ACTN|nr:hypothetical protein Psuf_059420 [Phytohabitans suffuscus]
MLIARGHHAGQETFGVVDGDGFAPVRDQPFERVVPAGPQVPLADVELLSPTRPSRVLVVLGGFLPPDLSVRPPDAEPVLFPKVIPWHLGHDGEVVKPAGLSGSLDMEAELALVIGRKTRSVTAEQGWDSIFGFTVYNDFTAAEFLPARDFYTAKSMDTLGSCGPWITTDLDRERIEAGIEIIGRVNGEQRQRGTTKRYKFDPGEIVAHASRFVTLLPGDIISLGTPPPAAPVLPGEVCEAEVEGIGVLRNHVA